MWPARFIFRETLDKGEFREVYLVTSFGSATNKYYFRKVAIGEWRIIFVRGLASGWPA